MEGLEKRASEKHVIVKDRLAYVESELIIRMALQKIGFRI